MFLCLSIVTYTYAHPWFGSTREHVASQYAYADTCVKVERVKTYFFGILISDEMEFTNFQCGPNHEERDSPIEN